MIKLISSLKVCSKQYQYRIFKRWSSWPQVATGYWSLWTQRRLEDNEIWKWKKSTAIYSPQPLLAQKINQIHSKDCLQLYDHSLVRIYLLITLWCVCTCIHVNQIFDTLFIPYCMHGHSELLTTKWELLEENQIIKRLI